MENKQPKPSESGILIIESQSQMPTGKLLSSAGDKLEIPERARKEMLAWDISTGDKKVIWVLSTRSAFQNNQFMQLVKTAEAAGYRVQRKGIIDVAVLNAIYDRRAYSTEQKATSDDSAVIASFEVILIDALKAGASDIHLEVRNTGGVVRMRINGQMMVYNPENRLSANEANNLASVIYTVLASTKDVSFDPRECQQAAVGRLVGDQEIKLRYQSVPAYPDGFDVVLRVLPIGRSGEFTALQKLGYTDPQANELVRITAKPVGALIIAGVTGSGKSTTLKNLLMFVNANSGYRLKIFTIEDPPEYNISGVTQIPVVIGKDFDPTKKSPFEKPIKACMRADPDIIMIGEVRDKMTGDLAKKAVQSGHQVLTTVHATSALGIIERLDDFGLSRSILGSPEFINGLLYQRLIPTVCKSCAVDFVKLVQGGNASSKDVEVYTRISDIVGDISKYPIKVSSEKGCKDCSYSGIGGRSVCAEVITFSLDMAQMVADAKTIPLMIYWRGLSDGIPDSEDMRGKTCMEHGFQKVLKGMVSPHALESSFKPIDEMLLSKKYKEMNDKSKKQEPGESNGESWSNL